MYELAELGARSIDLQYRAKQDVTTQDLEDLLKSVQIEGITSSYMYVAEKTTQVVTLSDEVMNVVNSTNEDSETLSRIAD